MVEVVAVSSDSNARIAPMLEDVSGRDDFREIGPVQDGKGKIVRFRTQRPVMLQWLCW